MPNTLLTFKQFEAEWKKLLVKHLLAAKLKRVAKKRKANKVMVAGAVRSASDGGQNL